MKKHVIAGAVLVALTGCFSHQYSVGRGASTDRKPVLSEWRSHWVYGLFGTAEVDVGKVCPSGNATVKDYHSFVNTVLGALIGWIWWPTTVEVYCDERTASLELTPAQLRAIGQSEVFARVVREFAPDRYAEMLAAREAHPEAAVCAR